MANLFRTTYADAVASMDSETAYIFSENDADDVTGVQTVKRELNRKMELARKYGYDEYADELAYLLEKLDAFRRARP